MWRSFVVILGETSGVSREVSRKEEQACVRLRFGGVDVYCCAPLQNVHFLVDP